MKIYCLPIREDDWESVDYKLLKYVSLNRQKKILNYRYQIDKKLSLYSALLTRMQLSKISGIPSSKLIFSIGQSGKPYVLLNKYLYFNISHTKSFILCCISQETYVGADVEKIVVPPLEIMDRCFHPDEIAYIDGLSGIQKEAAFFKVWTRKEAYVKMLGIGLNGSLPSINTLAPSRENLYLSWENNSYSFSVCAESFCKPEFHFLTESDIRNYYINYAI